MIYHLIVYIPCRTAMVKDNTNVKGSKTPLCVLANVYKGDGGTYMFIYENGVEKIDPFLCKFGCKYNNTGELLKY